MSFRRRVAMRAALVALSLVLIEAVIRVAAFAGYCNIRTFTTTEDMKEITYLGDINPYFGVWHKPNTTVTVATPRGPVTYRSNEHGMRDRPRNTRSTAPERVVVLGDSFVEGSHVEDTERFTDILEKQTGVEFLNFGTSGDFGSVQEWMLYQHLALRFDHTRVCLFLLPANDFKDNDPSRQSMARYRPYLSGKKDSFEVTYPMPFDKRPTRIAGMTGGRKLRNRVYNHWYTLNLMIDRDLSRLLDPMQRKPVLSSYDTYSEQDLERLLFSYGRILELAKPRKVYIFVIPRDQDFISLQTGTFKGRIVADLHSFAEKNPGIEVIDLLPHFIDYAKTQNVMCSRFFLGFDPHWSPLGHHVTADIVLKTLQQDGFKTSFNP